jgi:hypothetical protein
LIMKPQHFSNPPRMTDGAVGSDILVLLIDRMVGTGEEEEITSPAFPDVDERDIFSRPWIKLIELVRRADRPFFDVADHVLSRDSRLQPERRKSTTYRKSLTKAQWRRRFPPPLSHE